jgi:hypothetical protein
MEEIMFTEHWENEMMTDEQRMENDNQMTAEDIALELMQSVPEETAQEAPTLTVQANPYIGIASAPFSVEAAEILMSPIPDIDIEIRPDGLIYLPEIKYRRILNRAFGPGAWSLLPMDITVSSNDNMLYYRGALFVHGRFVSEAIGEQQYYATNDRMSYATAAESAKSNCLTRCCKDLGIASELWDPSFVRQWISTYAVDVWTENVGSNPSDRGKKRRMWRKKDAPAIDIFPWREEPSAASSRTAPPKAAPAKTEPVLELELDRTTSGTERFNRAQTAAENPAIISIRQAKRFRAIANEFGWSLDQVGGFLKSQGYNDPESIRRSEYDRLCSALENPEIRASYRPESRTTRHAKAA